MTNKQPYKVYINKANENWIIDRVRKEWIKYKNPHTNFKQLADIIWIISPWTWSRENFEKYKSKKIICSIHHIEEDKFKKNEYKNFKYLEQFIDAYHVISLNTQKQLLKYTDKRIISIPLWANQNTWFSIQDKYNLRKKYKIDINSFVVGSFQRDTEGSDLISPKLIKGPDRFLEIVKNMSLIHKNLIVLLAGKRRHYIISKLKENNIKYLYFEMVSNKKLNELYNCLDLYVVSSRIEGGPQAILECAMSKTPIISTNVGIAPEILSSESIYNMTNFHNAIPNIEIAYENSKELMIPNGFKKYKEMFESVLN